MSVMVRLRDRAIPALAYRDFGCLWRANLGSTMAFWMQTIAQGWLVLELTESPFILGLLAFFRAIYSSLDGIVIRVRKFRLR